MATGEWGSREGILAEGSLGDGIEGHRYAFWTPTRDFFSDAIHVHHPGWPFSGMVENMKDSLLRLMFDSCGGPTEASVWLSTYGIERPIVEAFEQRWSDFLRRLFA